MKTPEKTPEPETGARAALRAKGYIPAAEAARRLGFSEQSIYDWITEEKIHGVRLGRGRWVEWKSVVSYFKEKDPEAAKLAGIQ